MYNTVKLGKYFYGKKRKKERKKEKEKKKKRRRKKKGNLIPHTGLGVTRKSDNFV
jgi:hypothetical protein